MNSTRTFLAVLLVLLTCVAFQWYSRYSVAPFNDFCVDDWSLLEYGQSYDSYGASWETLLRWPDRPLGAAVLISTFNAVGDNPVACGLISMLLTALFLALALALVHELTASPAVTLAFGLIFSLLPNLTESFHWYVMTFYGPGFSAYLLSAWLWARMARTGRWIYVLPCVLFFALGLAQYETGILLPFAFLMLMNRSNRAPLAAGWVLLMAVVATFMAWRSTNGFGLCHDVLFPHRRVEFALPDMVWNAKETARWWVGGRMLACIANGLDRFLLLSNAQQFLFGALNAAVAVAAGALLFRMDRRGKDAPPPQRFPLWQLLLFAASWFAVTQFMSVISWAGGRQNYIPAVGASFFLAILLGRAQARAWVPAFVALGVVCLTANQGTSLNWRDSGEFQRRIFNYVGAHANEWKRAKCILFDTTSLRERQTPGITGPAGEDQSAWAYTGNASLLRGFLPNVFTRMAAPHVPSPKGILDMEYGARVEGDTLFWHEWYDPTRPRQTPTADVYVVDCLAVGSGQIK